MKALTEDIFLIKRGRSFHNLGAAIIKRSITKREKRLAWWNVKKFAVI